jgi:hypothetical protein
VKTRIRSRYFNLMKKVILPTIWDVDFLLFFIILKNKKQRWYLWCNNCNIWQKWSHKEAHGAGETIFTWATAYIFTRLSWVRVRYMLREILRVGKIFEKKRTNEGAEMSDRTTGVKNCKAFYLCLLIIKILRLNRVFFSSDYSYYVVRTC